MKATPSDDDRIRWLRFERDRLNVEIAAVEDGTLPWVERHGDVTPADLAGEFGLTVQAANNRLVRLVAVGLLTRERVPVPAGGRAFVYRVAPDQERNG